MWRHLRRGILCVAAVSVLYVLLCPIVYGIRLRSGLQLDLSLPHPYCFGHAAPNTAEYAPFLWLAEQPSLSTVLLPYCDLCGVGHEFRSVIREREFWRALFSDDLMP